MKTVRVEHMDCCPARTDGPCNCQFRDDQRVARIECRSEDIESDPSKQTCTGLREIGTGLLPCPKRAEWWVGDLASCSECVATFLSDEKSTVVVPITHQPMPSLEDCLFHRCVKHISVPQLNKEENGAECGACAQEAA